MGNNVKFRLKDGAFNLFKDIKEKVYFYNLNFCVVKQKNFKN